MTPDPATPTPTTASRKSDPTTVWMLMGLAAVFAWRVLFTSWLNLIPDECSYWTWSRSLDWSYFDNSGMVAYLIRVSTAFFGEQTPFSVRFPFLVLSGFTTYLIYRTSCILFQNRSRAVLAATVFNLTPIALLGGSAAIHDNALLFFWVVALWAAASFVRSEDQRWFYTMGAAAGLAIQSKYTGVIILPCVLIFLLWSGPHRLFLLRKEPWIGALIAAAFALPILRWNVSHQWASLHHIFFIGAGANNIDKQILDGIGYHLAQFLLVSPLFYFALVLGSAFGACQEFYQAQSTASSFVMFRVPSIYFWTSCIQRTRGSQLGFHGVPINIDPGDGSHPYRPRKIPNWCVAMVWSSFPEMGDDSLCGSGAVGAGTRMDRATSREPRNEGGEGRQDYMGNKGLGRLGKTCLKSEKRGGRHCRGQLPVMRTVGVQRAGEPPCEVFGAVEAAHAV